MAEVRPSRPPVSIAQRLVWSAVLLSAVILLIAGLVLSTLSARNAESGFDERLNVYLKALVADFAAFGESDRTEPGNLGEPRFELPISGWYWQISRVDGERNRPQVIKASKSLFAARLPALESLGVVAGSDGVFESYAEGPDKREVRIVERIIDLGEDGRYSVAVAGDPTELRAELRRFHLALWAALGLLGLALVSVTVAQVRFGLGPLADLRKAVGQIRRGEAERIDGAYPQEIAPLAEELNQLVVANHEVVERARTHVGNLAHALKTPLSVIVNEADAEGGPLADKVKEQTVLMRDQVQYYLDRARAAARAAAVGNTTDVEPTVNGLVRTFQKVYRDKALLFDSVIADGAKFRGEKQDFEEMLGNLIDNAGKWATSRVSVEVQPAPDTPKERPFLHVIVEDDGPGLPEDKRRDATRRGKRLDETRPGSGLGLSIVVDLAHLYGGTFQLEDSPLGGLRARLVLPAVAS